jgi:hypothetical protein
MTWIWVVLVIVALVGLLSWAAFRGRRHGGDNYTTIDEAKHDVQRRYGVDRGGLP